MKKHIKIPEVEGVVIAAVYEKNEEFRSMDWNIYLINENQNPLEMVLIVSKGRDADRITSTMRHSIELLPPNSFAKVEFLPEELLQLENTFSVSYFSEGKMFHKDYIFRRGSINMDRVKDLPLIPGSGVMAD